MINIPQLIKEMQISRERAFPVELRERIQEVFQSSNEADVRTVARECIDNPPSRIYAYIRNRLNELRGEREDRQHRRDDWKQAQQDKMSAEECTWLMAVIGVVIDIHTRGLVQRNAEAINLGISFDIEEYRKNMPNTWSPIIDQFLSGSVKPYYQSIQENKNALADYFKKYYQMLKNATDEQIIKAYGKQETF